MLQLQSILLPTEEVCNVQELYCHKYDGQIDFDGYFNLFYLEKRKKYTKINNLYLNIRLKGYLELLIIHNQKELRRVKLNPIEELEYFFEFPYLEYNTGVFSFSLIEDPDVLERTVVGYYSTELGEEEYQEVNIGIDICTFRRESYVQRNLRQLQDRLLRNRDLDVHGHIKIYIIDNGRTLHNDSIIQEMVAESEGLIQIYSNENVGGVGGFTRGMLEILRDKESFRLTHVLLMDEAAISETDSLVRLDVLLVTRTE